MFADSPNGLIGLTYEDMNAVCAAMEVKTLASPNTTEKAEKRRDAYSQFVSIEDVGSRHQPQHILRNKWIQRGTGLNIVTIV